MRVFWFMVTFMCIYGVPVGAQGENNIWTFGKGSGLDFNSGSPAFFESSLISKEGCASISDAFGNLLFYSSGSEIWDRDGNIMPHGNILGNGFGGSGTQAVLILKSLSNADEYYVFTLDPEEFTYSDPIVFGKMRYSIVNMKLNNGMGDVKPGSKDVLIESDMGERMTAVKSSDCGYWIVSHKRLTKEYVIFKLTANGLSGPVYATGVLPEDHSADVGEIKATPDGTKIALMFYKNSKIEIVDFDAASGRLSNPQVLDSSEKWTGYGLSFSPDNSKLYATMYGPSRLYQYDMSLYPNVLGMRANKVLVAEVDVYKCTFSGFRIGPDNKIYLVTYKDGYISTINNPNAFGTNCDFKFQSFPIDSAYCFDNEKFYGHGFGNPVINITYKDTLPGRFVDTLICFSDSVLLQVENNLLAYTWNDGVTGVSRYVHEDGIYYCLSVKECTMRMDTFRVQFVKGYLQLGTDTTICPGDSITLHASGDNFTWQDGSSDSIYVVREAGVYSVRISDKDCVSADSITIDVYRAGAFIIEGDTLICQGESLILHGVSIPEGKLTWSPGRVTDSIRVDGSGSYILETANVCGIFQDSVSVAIQDCDCEAMIPNAFSPNGDGRNDVFVPLFLCYPNHFQLSVYNRFGERIFYSSQKEKGWDGSHKGMLAEMGTYFYSLQYETPNGSMIRRKSDVILVR